MLLATKWVSVFGPFRPIFGQKIDPKLPRSHFFPKRIHQKKFQLKIPIFSKSDDDATWWPNSYKKILTCGQLRNIQRYQKYVRLVRAFFLELRTCSSQQCIMLIVNLFHYFYFKYLIIRPSCATTHTKDMKDNVWLTIAIYRC